MNQIGDYGMIGDCHSLALVGRDGSIDWLCFPRFDSPSVFARTLDADAGHFCVAPTGAFEVTRTYLPSTNVLATTFQTADGELELTDCMPVHRFDPDHPTAVSTYSSVLRRVRCRSGRVTVAVDLHPRFEYGTVLPRFTATSPHAMAVVGGPDALWVRASLPLEADRQQITARWALESGDEAWIETQWTPAGGTDPYTTAVDQRGDMAQRLSDTISFWEEWLARCSYLGDHTRRVHRSALVLKALTYAPTGAVVAAGTMSLPEWIGGGRNWDYRFTWIRDATLTLASLALLGYLDEAAAFKGWLERTGAGRPEDLQIMYRVTGERLLPEIELSHLRGHRDSGPVRIGNGAAGQVQLDSLGQLLEAGYLFGRAGGELTVDNAAFLCRVADLTVRAWRRPDQGIWEIRDEPRHFVHSKLNCWMALDRAVRLAEMGRLEGDVATWRRERAALASWLCDEGSPDGWYVQAAGHPLADAATLLVPALGFLPPADPSVLATIDVIQRDLSDGVLVHRYRSPDGLAGDEGAFLLCSFWLLDALIHARRLDEAETLLERLLALSNDVGLYAEMVDPTSGEHLGNTPQAFTHMAVVTSCSAISAARRDQLPPPDTAFSFIEAALDRRMAATEV